MQTILSAGLSESNPMSIGSWPTKMRPSGAVQSMVGLVMSGASATTSSFQSGGKAGTSLLIQMEVDLYFDLVCAMAVALVLTTLFVSGLAVVLVSVLAADMVASAGFAGV